MRRGYIVEMNDSKMKRELHEGESIIWQGEPVPFKPSDGDGKKSLTLRIVICAIVYAALMVAYAMLAKDAAGFNITVALVILVICAFVACVPILDARKVMDKSSYYITNDRVAVSIDGRDFMAMSRKGLKVKFIDAGNGCVHAAMGALADGGSKKLLTSAIIGKKDDKENVIGIVFYNVKDDGKLRDALAN